MTRLPSTLEIDFWTTDILGLSPSCVQMTILKVAHGLELTSEEVDIIEELTELPYRGPRRRNTLVTIAGARWGKNCMISLPMMSHAMFTRDYGFLRRGEVAMNVILAQDFRGGKPCFDYLRTAIEDSPLLSGSIVDVKKTEMELNIDGHPVGLKIYPASRRAARGTTNPSCNMDETAFLRDEATGANPDFEIERSLRRGQANVPDPLFLITSTPYARSGILWDYWRRREELTDNVLVVKCPTWLGNPTIPQSFFDQERERDPRAFDREYAASFAEGVASFLSYEVVDSAVRNYLELEPEPKKHRYVAGCDAAAGGQDAFTWSLGHRDGNRLVIDLVRGQRASKPETVVDEIVMTLKRYGVRSITGDRFSGSWVRDAFARRGIRYIVADRSRSDFYLEMLAPLNQGVVDLPRHSKLISELKTLERRTSKSGHDAVNHAPGQHDDHINSVAIVLVKLAEVSQQRRRPRIRPGKPEWEAWASAGVSSGQVLPGRQDRFRSTMREQRAKRTRELPTVPAMPSLADLDEGELQDQLLHFRKIIARLMAWPEQSRVAGLLSIAVERKEAVEHELCLRRNARQRRRIAVV